MRCVQCGHETEFGFATDIYTRRGTALEVHVTGIPADICRSCGESYVDIATAKEVEHLIALLFAGARNLVKLSPPTVTVAFPSLAPVEAG